MSIPRLRIATPSRIAVRFCIMLYLRMVDGGLSQLCHEPDRYRYLVFRSLGAALVFAHAQNQKDDEHAKHNAADQDDHAIGGHRGTSWFLFSATAMIAGRAMGGASPCVSIPCGFAFA